MDWIRISFVVPIEELIGQGVDTFYVGNHGAFDAAVRTCLKELSGQCSHICYGEICYIRHSWVGAYKFVGLAGKQRKKIINLC